MKTFIGIALLSCGEKIMGEFIEKVDYIEVSSPFGLREAMMENGTHTFIPYHFFPVSSEVKFIKIKRSSFCIEPYPIDEKLLNVYRQITSKLVVPQTKIIT
jgi:hypothetical protein